MNLEVTFHGLKRSEEIEFRVAKKAAKLEQIHGEVHSCRVVVRAPPKHKRRGSLFEVHIDAHYRGGDANISRSHHGDRTHVDPTVAVRDAFAALHKRLSHVKAH